MKGSRDPEAMNSTPRGSQPKSQCVCEQDPESQLTQEVVIYNLYPALSRKDWWYLSGGFVTVGLALMMLRRFRWSLGLSGSEFRPSVKQLPVWRLLSSSQVHCRVVTDGTVRSEAEVTYPRPPKTLGKAE